MMAPDILLIEADHDMRNPVDFLVLNKLARECKQFRVSRGFRRLRARVANLSSTPLFRSCSA